MKEFKLFVGDNIFYPIEKDVFEEVTEKREPYYQGNGNESRQFAVCPLCDNPIQIIGLYKEAAAVQPYGKHYCRSVPKLAIHDETTYQCCPYASNTYQKVFEKSDIFNNLSLKNLNIYKLVHDHFDKIVYVLNVTMDIHVTKALAKEMLIDFLKMRGHQYRGVTYSNIPWVLAYLSARRNLDGTLVRKDSKMFKALVDTDGIFFSESRIDGYAFCNCWRNKELQYVFMHHKQTNIDDELKEQMQLRIYSGDELLYTEIIDFRTSYFNNICRGDWKVTATGKALLDFAQSHMPEIQS